MLPVNSRTKQHAVKPDFPQVGNQKYNEVRFLTETVSFLHYDCYDPSPRTELYDSNRLKAGNIN